jgi:hypothetical protein
MEKWKNGKMEKWKNGKYSLYQRVILIYYIIQAFFTCSASCHKCDSD